MGVGPRLKKKAGDTARQNSGSLIVQFLLNPHIGVFG
jgi:hypothetical protein